MVPVGGFVMYKKNTIGQIYFAAMERLECGARVSTGVVHVEGRSGATYYISKIEATRNRIGVSERDFGVVDAGNYNHPVVFAATAAEAESALLTFLENEAVSAAAALDKMKRGDVSRVPVPVKGKK